MDLLERQLMEKWIWRELTAFFRVPSGGPPSSQAIGWRISEPLR